MDEERRDEGPAGPAPTHVVVRSRSPYGRIAGFIMLGMLIALVAAIVVVWVNRRPIAVHYLRHEFERRGVTASYHLDRVGLRTQEVSNLVIGDPKRPDLVARYAHIETRLRWNGNFDVYRIVARGVRLRGRLVHGKVSWGEIDKLLPPPSNKPFALPDFVLNVADSSISLVTPFGPLGIAVEGNGKLSGGFVGHAAIVSPKLVPGRCAATDLHTTLALAVVARRPQVEGPVTLSQFTCPASRFTVDAPRFDAKASFNEAFTSVDGSGRMAIAVLDSGANGLADFAGDITYKGALNHVDGRVKLSAQQSRMGTIYAARTRLNGGYHLGIRDGTFALVGQYAADNAQLNPKMIAGVTQPLAAAAKTPLGPVVTAIGNALVRTAANFNSSGHLRVVNFPGGGAARVLDADVIGPGGAHARVFGGSGVTYYWPSGGLRIDGSLDLGGGGLPQGRVTLHQPRPNGPMSGLADLAPYTAPNGQRLALAPLQFGPGPNGSTALSTVAQLDGPFPDGRVQALRLPINGQIGHAGSFAFGTSCLVVSFNALQLSTLKLGATRLPVCPIGRALVSKQPGGKVVTAARFNAPTLNGTIGSSPLHVQAAGGQLLGQQFSFNRLGARLGRETSPIVFDAARLSGSFAGSLHGNFTGAGGTIGKVPLQLSDGVGSWLFRSKALSIDGAATVSDRNPNPRFYPLRTNDLHFSLAGDYVRATGSLRHPATGTLVTNVSIEHQLKSGAGHALLDVPGLAFGPSFQPDALTRLTEGVVALVNGTVRGQGRIDWGPGGKLTSTGDFSTSNMAFAAPFGPVTGFSTNLHFTDLLALETAPHQLATVETINPGILVTNGSIRYQLLPHNLVKIDRGEWPFMGGKLILHETVLNFGSPSEKKLTFELQGFDAKQFVDTLGFSGLELDGIFDGVLPMVFDQSGGRIVGGRLTSRAPGGELKYTGTKPKGMAAGIAFGLLQDIRFKSMVVRLDGDLAGEFATRMTIDGVSLGPAHGFVAGLVHRVFSQIPMRLNVNVNGPFRALIQMAKAFKDPTQAIAPVMPFPIDSPALKVDVISSTKNEEQASAPAQPQTTRTSPPPGGKK